jgi:hypothetical protein
LRTGPGELLNSRFKSNYIAHELTLIPFLVTHLPCPIDHLHSRHPFVNGKLILSSKVMDVSDQAAHYLPHPRGSLWPHSLDDMLCEGRIESRVSRHISTAIRRGHLSLLYIIVANGMSLCWPVKVAASRVCLENKRRFATPPPRFVPYPLVLPRRLSYFVLGLSPASFRVARLILALLP